MKEINIPVIGIVGVNALDDENDPVVALYDNYRKLCIAKDCIPFMITPMRDIDYEKLDKENVTVMDEREKNFYIRMLSMCDGIIIPGGYGIYDYHNFIVKYAIDNDMPLLGTCLGMQILANYDNGSRCLVEDESGIHKQRGAKYVHDVNIVPGTLLDSIIEKKRISVNSVHKYCVSGVKDFVVSAYSDDKVIEAIELPTKNFIVGVEWHPEKMLSYDLDANKLVDRFVDECVRYKNRNILTSITRK